MIKLSEYARKHGCTKRTAWTHFKKGLIEGAYQLPSGRIVIPDRYDAERDSHVVVYSRVSSSENKDNLNSQAARLSAFCAAKGWIVAEDVREIGSGLNDSRPKLLKILSDRKATLVVVEHKDRLARFGVPYIRECCKGFGCRLEIINESSDNKEDLMNDFVAVVTSFCARLYGQRRNKRRAEKLIQGLK